MSAAVGRWESSAARPGTVVALDVGGTAIKAAVIGDGTVSSQRAVPTGVGHGPDAVAERVCATAAVMVTEARSGGREPDAVGVAIPGLVDPEAGVARFSRTFGWRELPLAAQIEDRVGVPVLLGHDARAGAVAESRTGAGRGHTPILFVAVGAGVGSAVVDSPGRVREGDGHLAGELGQLRTVVDGPAVEDVASGVAIARAFAARLGLVEGTVDARDTAAAVRAGDEDAAAVWSDAVGALAQAIAAAVLVVAPARVVVGGGLAQAGDTLLSPLRRAVARLVAVGEIPDIRRAAHGTLAGCLGAGMLAADSRPVPGRTTA